MRAVTRSPASESPRLNAKTLSTYLGHATITITLDRYGHLMPGSESKRGRCWTLISTIRKPKPSGYSLAVARLSRRALWLFLGYVALLAAVVLAGFLAEAIGLWAALLWGAAFLGVAFIWMRQRMASRAP
jgi:hypothetical protein